MKLSMCSRGLALPLVTTLLAGVDAAPAATFTYDGYNVTNEQDIQISQPNNIYGGAGQIVLIGSGSNAGQDIPAWCLDVFVYLSGSATYQIIPAATTALLNSAQIGEIGSLIANGDALLDQPNNGNVSAAIQLAIWQVEYGISNFQYSGLSTGVTNDATTFYNDATTGTWKPDYNLSLLSPVVGPANQTLGFVTPLPPTWTLMLSGFVGLGFFAYWGTKNRSAAAAVA